MRYNELSYCFHVLFYLYLWENDKYDGILHAAGRKQRIIWCICQRSKVGISGVSPHMHTVERHTCFELGSSVRHLLSLTRTCTHIYTNIIYPLIVGSIFETDYLLGNLLQTYWGRGQCGASGIIQIDQTLRYVNYYVTTPCFNCKYKSMHLSLMCIQTYILGVRACHVQNAWRL